MCVPVCVCACVPYMPACLKVLSDLGLPEDV